MKTGFYPRLALSGIGKNRRLVLPYFLTCVAMIMMTYIIFFLSSNEVLATLPAGAGLLQALLNFGGWVIALFSCLFLFYTNSFLIRRRKKEFGLYHILGMGKRNIARILFWEVLMIACASLVLGLILGIAFSKLAELGLVNILHGTGSYTLFISPPSILYTCGIFGVIFLLLFLNALRQVRSSSAISLVRSENTGEKPPKGNWFFGLLGLLLLAAAYTIAITIQDPLSALTLFFIAVLMVIAGTYLLMIAGSVLFCRILQRWRNYYYKPNHFVSVSSMVYRMKRNGAGLASICILATMVLVMVSSTTCLYFGSEDALTSRYPRQVNLSFYFSSPREMSDQVIASMREELAEQLRRHNTAAEQVQDYRQVILAGSLNGAQLTEVTFPTESGVSLVRLYVLPLSDYNRMTGREETLESGQALLASYRIAYQEDVLSLPGGASFSLKTSDAEFLCAQGAAVDLFSSLMLVVSDGDFSTMDWVSQDKTDSGVSPTWTYNFDVSLEPEQAALLCSDLRTHFQSLGEQSQLYRVDCEEREANRADFYSLYGGLLYLGIILSLVFLFAAVLIIYYKQISEGYEDQSRFTIMQKVGMTRREIRKSINSQLLTVFSLPILGAGCHLLFAFPMIQKLLLMFNLNNVSLFAQTTAISFLVFLLFYILVYRITSNAYYHIVSGAKSKRS